MSGASRNQKIATLKKRADWLERRIGEATAVGDESNALSHDRRELTALRWAISELGGPEIPKRHYR